MMEYTYGNVKKPANSDLDWYRFLNIQKLNDVLRHGIKSLLFRIVDVDFILRN